MKKRKLISMLRLLALPVALAIGSGTASATVLLGAGNSTTWTINPTTFKAGTVTQNLWVYDKTNQTLSLDNSETVKILESTWVYLNASKKLTEDQVYTIEYTVEDDASKAGIEIYLATSSMRKRIFKIGDTGVSKVNFKGDGTVSSYYVLLRGCKQNGVSNIKITGVTLTENTDPDPQNVVEVTSSSFGSTDGETYPYNGVEYNGWYIIEQFTAKADSYTWGPGANSGEMYINTATGTGYASNDWLITQNPVEFKADEEKTITFNFKTGSTSAENIVLYAAKSKDVNSLKNGEKLWPASTSIASATESKQEVSFTPSEAGTYYFGFICTSKNKSGITISDFNVEGATSELVFDIDTPFVLPFDGTQDVKGNYLTDGAYTNELSGTDGYCPDFNTIAGDAKTSFNWKDSKVDIDAPYEINVAGVTMKLQGKEGCGVPTLSSTNSKLQFPATFTDGRIYFNAPSGFYFKSIKLAGEGMGASTDFDVNVDGTCAYSDGFVWTAAAGAVESEVMFESNLAGEFAISSFVVEFVDPDTFVAEPTEITYYSSTIGAGEGVLDKGWKPLNGDWTAAAGKVSTAAPDNGFTLRSPKFYLNNAKEYVVKLTARIDWYEDEYTYKVYMVTNPEVLSDEDIVATWGVTSSSVVTYETLLNLGARESGEYYFVVEMESTSTKGVTLFSFAVNELLHPESYMYKFNHDNGFASEVLSDANATIYDFRDYKDEIKNIVPTNTNAYVIGGSNIIGKYYPSTGLADPINNKLAYDAENNAYSASSISLDGDKPFYFGYDVDVTKEDGITFNRTLDNELRYVTLILPFKVKAANFGANEFYVFNGFKEVDEVQCLNFQEVVAEDIEAYTPIMLKPAYPELVLTGSEGIVSHATTTPAEKKIFTTEEKDGWQMAWSTEEFTLTQDELASNTATKGKDVYFLKNNKYYKAAAGVTVTPFRVFYLKTTGGAMGAPSYNFLINGDVPTGLESLFEDELRSNEGPAYNEAGVRVDNNYKGIKIRNGKKVIENR